MQVEGNVVLVVDDDEMNLIVAQTVLEKKLNCKVITAGNGTDGIEILRRQYVSVVLLDIEMPFMDGFEALKEIRSDAKIRHVPVIMLTATADKDTITKVARQGVSGYIKKPFLPEDMVKRVKECLESDKELKNILIVDEEENVCRTAKKIIDETLPFGVLTVDSGIAALELLKTRHVDIILLNYALPFMNGLRTVDLLAKNEHAKNICVVMMTETEKEEEKVIEGMSAQPMIVDFVRKPLTKKTLIPKLAKAMK